MSYPAHPASSSDAAGAGRRPRESASPPPEPRKRLRRGVIESSADDDAEDERFILSDDDERGGGVDADVEDARFIAPEDDDDDEDPDRIRQAVRDAMARRNPGESSGEDAEDDGEDDAEDDDEDNEEEDEESEDEASDGEDNEEEDDEMDHVDEADEADDGGGGAGASGAASSASHTPPVEDVNILEELRRVRVVDVAADDDVDLGRYAGSALFAKLPSGDARVWMREPVQGAGDLKARLEAARAHPVDFQYGDVKVPAVDVRALASRASVSPAVMGVLCRRLAAAGGSETVFALTGPGGQSPTAVFASDPDAVLSRIIVIMPPASPDGGWRIAVAGTVGHQVVVYGAREGDGTTTALEGKAGVLARVRDATIAQDADAEPPAYSPVVLSPDGVHLTGVLAAYVLARFVDHVNGIVPVTDEQMNNMWDSVFAFCTPYGSSEHASRVAATVAASSSRVSPPAMLTAPAPGAALLDSKTADVWAALTGTGATRGKQPKRPPFSLTAWSLSLFLASGECMPDMFSAMFQALARSVGTDVRVFVLHAQMHDGKIVEFVETLKLPRGTKAQRDIVLLPFSGLDGLTLAAATIIDNEPITLFVYSSPNPDRDREVFRRRLLTDRLSKVYRVSASRRASRPGQLPEVTIRYKPNVWRVPNERRADNGIVTITHAARFMYPGLEAVWPLSTPFSEAELESLRDNMVWFAFGRPHWPRVVAKRLARGTARRQKAAGRRGGAQRPRLPMRPPG